MSEMQYNIQGHHLDVGDALKTHIQDKLDAINEKYFNRGIEATVTMTKDGGSTFKTHISMKGGKDIIIQADSSAHDPYGSFEEAAEKVAKQLRRYKRRLRDHHNREENDVEQQLHEAQSYVISRQEEPANDEAEEFENGDEPLIIAETKTNILKLSVSDAVMHMELSNVNALMFKNAQNGELNVVYKRADGNIGWIDPAKK
jgi:ribosomal subunit interface protein|tara:strand:- start:126 stop:728 length:603 start_codon:yes stop_codon:yes gene_type:complete